MYFVPIKDSKLHFKISGLKNHGIHKNCSSQSQPKNPPKTPHTYISALDTDDVSSLGNSYQKKCFKLETKKTLWLSHFPALEKSGGGFIHRWICVLCRYRLWLLPIFWYEKIHTHTCTVGIFFSQFSIFRPILDVFKLSSFVSYKNRKM